MKIRLALAAAVLLTASSCFAQTNSFFTTVEQWATSFNTNNTAFVSTRGMMDTGVESRSGDGIALINDLHLSYDLVGTTYAAPTNTTSLRFGPDVVERNSGVTGTFVAAQGGLQLAEVYYDFRFGVAVDGGYWAQSANVRHHIYGEVALDADKAMTSRTYMGVRFAQEFTRNAQGYYVKLGFTF